MHDVLHNERELLRLIAEGNEAAYRRVFDHYWKRLYALGLKMTKSPEQAKDLVQEIFVKLWVHRQLLPQLQHFEGFLFTVARNQVRDFLKKRVFQPGNDGYMLEYLTQEPVTPEQVLEGTQAQHAVDNIIKRLPPQMQKAFLLRFQGYSHDEIARVMHISKVTSKSYIVRALDYLRKHLAENPEALLVLLIWFSQDH
ncbi:RNA polymerase sigma factor [Chitinophaga agrisoli]|uniref:RNA polymerase sigma factor n=1 Tax=Chitinophaga agrisoli TaxID=2607653 RepID=A0A5B2VRF0_9BACT|nr:RNA polymerase sigma factor [Chitinophaga agrisoli]KAA2240757.1 RNA polymerase sigma factor [Chitinophaga agrisoli]